MIVRKRDPGANRLLQPSLHPCIQPKRRAKLAANKRSDSSRKTLHDNEKSSHTQQTHEFRASGLVIMKAPENR